MNLSCRWILPLFAGLIFSGVVQAMADEPFKLDAEQRNYIPGNQPIYPAYPAPQMIPTQPLNGSARKTNARPALPVVPSKAQSAQKAPASAPLSAGVDTFVILPPAFLGVWQVQGQRIKVEALPEFAAGAEQAFALNNNQLWTISGSAGAGYTLGSNTGVTTPLTVDKVQGTTAFIRYQHPVGNTMAQEAIVMTLVQGGAQFNGLERISIVKQGLPTPRVKVTYQLFGRRQR